MLMNDTMNLKTAGSKATVERAGLVFVVTNQGGGFVGIRFMKADGTRMASKSFAPAQHADMLGWVVASVAIYGQKEVA